MELFFETPKRFVSWDLLETNLCWTSQSIEDKTGAEGSKTSLSCGIPFLEISTIFRMQGTLLISMNRLYWIKYAN